MPRWEPPDPHKLLITGARLAEELRIPAARAPGVASVLEQVFIGATHTRYRVTRRSVDRLKDLLDVGLTLSQACVVMWEYKRMGMLPSVATGEVALVAVKRDEAYWRAVEQAVQRRMDRGQTRRSAEYHVKQNREERQYIREDDSTDPLGLEWIQGRQLYARRRRRRRS